jgi:hypothetical protein
MQVWIGRLKSSILLNRLLVFVLVSGDLMVEAISILALAASIPIPIPVYQRPFEIDRLGIP